MSTKLPLAIGMIGAAASVAGALWMQAKSDQEARTRFDHSSQRVEAEVLRRFLVPLHGLRGLAGAYAVNGPLRRDAFRAFVVAREIDKDFPGVRGFGFIQHVPRGGLDAFVAAERADAAPGFGVRQLDHKDLDDLYVIKHIEPYEQNVAARGLDVGSESARRAAIELALRSGQPAITAPVLLVQDGGRTPGFLVFQPVYRHGARPETPEARLASRLGAAYAPIIASELLKGSTDAAQLKVDFQLFHGHGDLTSARLVYDDDQPVMLAADGAPPAARYERRRFVSTREIDVMGSPFTLRIASNDQFEATVDRKAPALALLAGLLLSGLLAFLVRINARSGQRAEALAQRMTLKIDRLSVVARHTSNAVIVTDKALRITWVNDAFIRTYGYSREQAIGRKPGELLGSGKTRPEALETLRLAAEAGRGCRVDVINRTADGREIWVDTEVQPVRDADGVLTGFVEMASDVTERRTVEQRLATLARENEALLSTIREHTIVSMASPDGVIIEANDAFCAISGYSREELLGQNHRIICSGVQPKAFWAHMWETISAGRPWRGQICNRAKDGRLYWVDSIIAPFVNADGSIEKYVSLRTDITARKESERQLARERQQLANILEGTNVGTWEWSIESGQVKINGRWAEMLGYSQEELATLDIDAWAGLVHPDDIDALREKLRRHFKGESRYFDCESRLRHRDGHWIWVLDRGKVFGRDGQGRARWMAGTQMDITRRKEAQHAREQLESELRRQNAVMSSVLENLPCGLSVFDERLELVASNQAYRRLLEFPDHLFATGRPRFEDFIRHNAERGEYGPGDVEEIVQAIVAKARGTAVAHRFERVRPTGLPLEVCGAPMPGGGFVTTYTDITDRKRSELKVQRSEAVLRGAIDAVDEAFVLYDPDDRLVFCNDKYRQTYAGTADLIEPGISFEALVRAGAERGHYLEALGRVDEWVAERVALHRRSNTTLVQKLRDGRTLRIVERRLPDGHIVGFRIDITELSRAVQAAEEASRMKSRFLANMSHEIRTPMNATLGMLTLLRRSELNARQADYAAKAEGAARSLLGLLNDILDFSKVEAGKMTLESQPFEPEQLLRDLSVILSTNAGGKPLELLFDVDPALPRRLVGDALRLQQVLTNLGGNAIKFTERGSVVVSLRVGGRSAEGVRVDVAVSDTGIGIAPENQARIFDGFTQAEASTTRRFGGTGLGLAICQRLVGLMGGEIRLDSALGRGSRFHFSIVLPEAAEAAEAGGDADATAGDGGGLPDRLHALVVDDNPMARQLLQSMLLSLGWTVDVAASGEAALALVDAHPDGYGAAFVDWRMPGMDGWATCHGLRKRWRGPAAPAVVMITAQGREVLAQRDAQEHQLIDAFLVKPVTASMLRDAVVEARVRPGGVRSLVGAAAAPAAPRRLAGLRLLVVEDNPNNQQVARELLEDEGATVALAGNGQEGVDAVAGSRPPFDLVLMDLQMPVMDGYTATRLIRQLPDAASLPVVAMTANAMRSDRRACLDAGMNEHVGKPFDIEELVLLLLRLCGRGAPAALPAPAAAAPRGAAEPPAPSTPEVDLAGALARLGGKRDLYRRLLVNFINDLRGFPGELQDSVARDDGAGAARQLHTLKGLAGSLGLRKLAAQAAEAEKRLLDSATPAQAQDVARGFVRTLEDTAPALAGLRRELDEGRVEPAPAPSQPGGGAALVRSLRALRELLAAADMEAMDVVQRLRDAHPGLPGGQLEALEAAVTRLDFEAGQQLCQHWLTELTEMST